MFDRSKFKPEDLTDEEITLIISALHMAGDIWADAADDTAGREHPEDREFSKLCDKRLDVLDSARRKLGDTWEPDPSFKAPDTIEGLEDE